MKRIHALFIFMLLTLSTPCAFAWQVGVGIYADEIEYWRYIKWIEAENKWKYFFYVKNSSDSTITLRLNKHNWLASSKQYAKSKQMKQQYDEAQADMYRKGDSSEIVRSAWPIMRDSIVAVEIGHDTLRPGLIMIYEIAIDDMNHEFLGCYLNEKWIGRLFYHLQDLPDLATRNKAVAISTEGLNGESVQSGWLELMQNKSGTLEVVVFTNVREVYGRQRNSSFPDVEYRILISGDDLPFYNLKSNCSKTKISQDSCVYRIAQPLKSDVSTIEVSLTGSENRSKPIRIMHCLIRSDYKLNMGRYAEEDWEEMRYMNSYMLPFIWEVF